MGETERGGTASNGVHCQKQRKTGEAFKAMAQENEIIFCMLASIKKQCAASGGGSA